MKILDKNNIWLLLILESALATLLIIVGPYFPFFGLGLSLAILSTTVYFFQKERTRFHKVLYILTLLLSFCLFYRANPGLTAYNVLAIIFLGSFMAWPHANGMPTSFINFIVAPLNAFFQGIRTKSSYSFNDTFLKKDTPLKKIAVTEIGKSLAITILILAVIIPLLATANPFFADLIGNIITFFNIEKILESLFKNYVLWFFRGIVFLVLAFWIPRFVSYSASATTETKPLNFLASVQLLLPKIIVALVLGIFFITQAQLYTASSDTLARLGYLNYQYAREVFGQLLIVAGIIGVLLYNDRTNTKWSRILTYLLSFEVVMLAFAALKSVFDYTVTYGLTFKRIEGYIGVVWITGVVALFLYRYTKNLSDSFFVKAVIVFSALELIAVNCLNIDRMIYDYNRNLSAREVDSEYLSGLSSDAMAYQELWKLTEERNKKILMGNPGYLPNDYRYSAYRYPLLMNIEYLQKKYRQPDFRTFNLSEYAQYRQIRDIKIPEQELKPENYY